MFRPGAYSDRVSFERRETIDDGYGNVQGAWGEVWRCWAHFRPRFGREDMEAGRMEATMRGTLTVRSCAESKSITNGDRVVFVAGPYTGRAAQIQSIVPGMDGDIIEFKLEEGIAT